MKVFLSTNETSGSIKMGGLLISQSGLNGTRIFCELTG
jgi:hypothetical protein